MELRYEILGFNPMLDVTGFNVKLVNHLMEQTSEKVFKESELPLLMDAINQMFSPIEVKKENLVFNELILDGTEILKSRYRPCLSEGYSIHTATQVVEINKEFEGITPANESDIVSIYNDLKNLGLISHVKTKFFDSIILNDIRKMAFEKNIILSHHYRFVDLYINYWLDTNNDKVIPTSKRFEFLD